MGDPVSSTTGPLSIDDCVGEANQTTLRRWRVLMSTTYEENFGGPCSDSWVIVEAPNRWAAHDRARDGIIVKEPVWVTRVREDNGLLFVVAREIRR
jgi:hypothetical protein